MIAFTSVFPSLHWLYGLYAVNSRSLYVTSYLCVCVRMIGVSRASFYHRMTLLTPTFFNRRKINVLPEFIQFANIL